jgi:hypothetical protein
MSGPPRKCQDAAPRSLRAAAGKRACHRGLSLDADVWRLHSGHTHSPSSEAQGALRESSFCRREAAESVKLGAQAALQLTREQKERIVENRRKLLLSLEQVSHGSRPLQPCGLVSSPCWGSSARPALVLTSRVMSLRAEPSNA